MAFALTAVPARTDAPDVEIPNGWFFTQAGGGGSNGFAVTDDGGVGFWASFGDAGGVSQLGYPTSRRWTDGSFTYQAYQKAILQWQPEPSLPT